MISNDKQIKPMSLRRNFSWTFTGNVIYAACQWGMLMAMAKLGTPVVVGQYTLGLAVTAPVFMLTNLQLRGVQATDAKDEHSFGEYLGLRISGSAVALAIILLIIWFGGYRGETAVVIMLLGLAKFIESVSDICFGLAQKHEQMQLIAKSHIVKGILSLVVLVIILIVTGSITLSIVGLIISWFLVLVLYDWVNTRNFSEPQPVFSGEKLWPLARLSLPLGAVMALISLNSNIPRYFIEHELSIEALGYFSAMAYLIVAGNTVVSALGQSASPRLAKYFAFANMKAYRRLLLKLALLGAGLGIMGLGVSVTFGREILALLYTPEYAEYAGIFNLIIVSAGIGYVASFLGYGLTAARFFKIQPAIFCIVTLVSLSSCAILIPIAGLKGAAYALIITSLVQLLVSLLAIVYKMHFIPAKR
ncbi:lipopolysaccharide biosynthesis protein [Desulfallas thermosapovorans]|uniref:O-antigen/teichoic acid export membrane protein n=1 Tax=Desulfallas thermosapovorans DSM 6562 TaxID=1121431 RepID=A0A5S4ZN12_9FIRM|nr:oligosaccharide flippase family protein [Desulfallas thermosapovorans]TYO93243.1 O-antigen/teichoic acid export membrane protein [Desulfallas thermosapovorans DSM 6562]